jgi:proline iminopeptidase
MAEVREGLITVPGGRVWFSIHGRPSARPPLLVLHGGPGAPHDYLSPLECLADERQVIFYDQLGCGRSDRPDDETLWTVDRFVEELWTVREELEIEEMHVSASSWGTMLLTSFIERHGQRGIRSIVMSGPAISTKVFLDGARSLIGNLPEDMRDAIWRAEEKGSFDDAAYQTAMNAYYHRHVCRLDPWPECVERMFAGMGAHVYRKMWGPSEFTCDGALMDFDNTHVLPDLKMPVLYTCGEHDEAAPEGVKKYRDATPGSELLVLPGASHMHHLERPAEFFSAVRSFIQNADRR